MADQIKESILSPIDNPENSPKEKEVTLPPIRSWVALSIASILIFSSFNGIQNLQSSVNTDENRGMASLTVVYGILLLLGPFAPILAWKWNPKILLILFGIANAIYVICNVYPSYSTQLPASFILGITTSWNGMCFGLYLSAIGSSYVTLKGLDSIKLHGILSVVNGAYYFCFEMSQVFGNLISSVTLFSSSYNDTLRQQNVCGARVCGATDNYGVKSVNSTDVGRHGRTYSTFTEEEAYSNATHISTHERNQAYIEKPDVVVFCVMIAAFGVCCIGGTMLMAFLLPKLPVDARNEEETPISLRLLSTFQMLTNLKFVLVTPCFLAQAAMVMILFTGYTKAYVSCALGIKWVGYVMVAFGVSSSTFAIATNYTAQFVGRKLLLLTYIGVDIGILFAMLLWTPSSAHSKFLYLLIPTAAGISEGISQPQFNALISTIFKETEAQAFAGYHFCKCITFVTILALNVTEVTCIYHTLYICLALYGLALIGYITMEVLVARDNSVDDARNGGHSEDSLKLNVATDK